MICQFNLQTSPLEGTNLIEASAGTGKTYTITGLFLRMLLEKQFPVNSILVVTFTEAATEELRSRIRSLIKKAILAFSEKLDAKDEDYDFLISLVEKSQNLNQDLEQLKLALNGFDEAAIFTIHGFCQRMLLENAFESGILFDCELIKDQRELIREIIEDFWRINFYDKSPLFLSYAFDEKLFPEELFSLVANHIHYPFIKILPEVSHSMEQISAEVEENEYIEIFKKTRYTWNRNEIEELLLNCKALNRKKYPSKSISKWINEMDDFLSSKIINLNLPEKAVKFSTEEILLSTNKGKIPPHHVFFDCFGELLEKRQKLNDIYDFNILNLLIKMFNYYFDEIKKRKQKKSIQSFDDLLVNTYNALKSERGEDLSHSILKKYKAALIDEFQDTDPIQYYIFNTIFKNSILFLIGDPKQAIYSFRGADIFAYMEASKNVKNKYTLVKNWRSSPDLIKAINTIYENAENQFIFEDIAFHSAIAAPKKPEFIINEKNTSPMQIWFMPREEDQKNISKGLAYELISEEVAKEIIDLLNLASQKKILIKNEKLKASDIAILVRKHSQAIIVQEVLQQYGIPVVMHSTKSIYESYEIQEIFRVMKAVYEYNNEGLLRAALTTDLMGKNGDDIIEMHNNQEIWERIVNDFVEYNQVWKKNGFVQMFRILMKNEKVRERLLKYPDGERRLTNILHASEVINGAEIENKIGPKGLIDWLGKKFFKDKHEDETQVRLETDDNVVKIVTIHKSKGLEYPVVFCPFSWDGSKIKSGEHYTFHDKNNNKCLPLGKDEIKDNKKLAEKELMAENTRLFYVALTRAKYRCYFVWGAFNNAETSAASWLFHQPETIKNSKDLIGKIEKHFKKLSDTQIYDSLQNLAEKSNNTLRVKKLSDIYNGDQLKTWLYKNEEYYQNFNCQNFTGIIENKWQVASFSSLTSNHSHAAEIPDRDETVQFEYKDPVELIKDQITNDENSIFSFPKGAKPGTFIHDVFEHIDFTENKKEPVLKLIEEKLTAYGFETKWAETIYEMVYNVLDVPLFEGRTYFTLSKIPKEMRLNEMEFYLPLDKINPFNLASILKKHQKNSDFPNSIEKLSFKPIKGQLKGFIDLVFNFRKKFYIVDWKSNYLGPTITDYEENKLSHVMEQEFYTLQYLIYSVALHKYLAFRLKNYNYEEYFGGIFYIFTRGVNSQEGPKFGIYHDLPKKELIEDLANYIVASYHRNSPRNSDKFSE